jgi:hypothetical protein
MLNVWIGNLGKYNEGELVGEWLELPVSKKELDAFLREKVGLQLTQEEVDKALVETGVCYEEYMINDYETDLPIKISEYTNLTMLNLLALASEKVNNMEAIEAYIDSQSTDDIEEIINIMLQEDDIPFYSYEEDSEYLSNEEKYGMSKANWNGLQEVLDQHNVSDYFDYERYGADDDVILYDTGYLDSIESGNIDLHYYSLEEIKETLNYDEEEIEIIKNELKKDPKFIQMCQNRAMSENEKLEELEMQIENLKGKKNYIEESIAELELHHKKQRKQLAEEFEKEKQINNARIIEMQNTTIEQEKDKPSFWNKIADKIFNFKIVATVSFVMYQLSNKVPPERILKNVKHFRKNYDKYVENPELIQRELKIMEYMDIGLSKIEESEKIDLNKEKSRDDYDLEL